MNELLFKSDLVLLTGLKCHIRTLDHFFEHLDLRVFLIYSVTILSNLFFPLLLMALLDDSLLISQLLGLADQLADVLETFIHLLSQLFVVFFQRIDSLEVCDLSLFHRNVIFR